MLTPMSDDVVSSRKVRKEETTCATRRSLEELNSADVELVDPVTTPKAKRQSIGIPGSSENELCISGVHKVSRGVMVPVMDGVPAESQGFSTGTGTGVRAVPCSMALAAELMADAAEASSEQSTQCPCRCDATTSGRDEVPAEAQGSSAGARGSVSTVPSSMVLAAELMAEAGLSSLEQSSEDAPPAEIQISAGGSDLVSHVEFCRDMECRRELSGRHLEKALPSYAASLGLERPVRNLQKQRQSIARTGKNKRGKKNSPGKSGKIRRRSAKEKKKKTKKEEGARPTKSRDPRAKAKADPVTKGRAPRAKAKAPPAAKSRAPPSKTVAKARKDPPVEGKAPPMKKRRVPRARAQAPTKSRARLAMAKAPTAMKGSTAPARAKVARCGRSSSKPDLCTRRARPKSDAKRKRVVNKTSKAPLLPPPMQSPKTFVVSPPRLASNARLGDDDDLPLASLNDDDSPLMSLASPDDLPLMSISPEDLPLSALVAVRHDFESVNTRVPEGLATEQLTPLKLRQCSAKS